MASRRIRRTKSLAGYTAAVYQDLIDLKARSNYRSIAASAITGDSLAEEIEIFNKSMQSSNYLPGVDGWKIDGSGNAEFGNVYVRGDINAYSGTIGYWNISNPSVERTFGTTTLFGTFLESFDHGFTDVGTTTGTYVSLFKSYVDVPTAITKISVTSDIVTLTAPDHNFIVGDKIVVEFDDAAYDAYESDTYLIITETTPDTFSYLVRGTPAGTAGVQQAEIEASGTAQIYNEDIAGLYLRDYAKTSFDYGFFSNKGISYVSAEVLNLVHNPSFEYKVNGTNTYSNSGWSATSGISQATLSASTYTVSSSYGALIEWTTARTDSLNATVDYNAGNDYKIFDSSKTLYLGFEIFSALAPTPVTVTAVSVSNVSSVTVTASGHGLSANDYVYLDFYAKDTEDVDFSYDSDSTYGPRVFSVVSVSGSTFNIANGPGVAATGAVTVTARLGASARIYPKVISPALKLSDIKLKFGSSETALANVLTDVYTTEIWSVSGNQEISISATDIIENSVIPPMKNAYGVSYVEIDSSKIKSLYSSLDPSGLANANTFQIIFPTKLYKKDLTGSTTATELTNTSYIIDNVYLSRNNKFFYADSSATHSWYTAGTGTSSPQQASLESPRTWIDVDLDNQKSIFNYIDYLGFESSTYYQPLLNLASISTAPWESDFTYRDYLSSKTLKVLDSNTLNISSGIVSYPAPLSTQTTEKHSYINVSADKFRTGVELSAKSKVYTTSTETTLYGSGASLSAFIDSTGKNLVGIQADYIVAYSTDPGTAANVARFITPDGEPSLDASYIINNTSNSKKSGNNHLAYTHESTTATTVSETYAPNTVQCFAYFTTGPSGYAEISVYGYIDSSNAAGITYLSFEIAPASDITTPVISANDSRAVINQGTSQMGASVFYLFNGDPWTRYKVRTMMKTNNALYTATAYRRSVMAIPIT